MGAITIRNLDDRVIERMKAEAARRGRSMEEEARQALSRQYEATFSPEEWAARKQTQFEAWGWSEERRSAILEQMLVDLDDLKENGAKSYEDR